MYPSFLQPSAAGQPLSLSLLLLFALLTLISAHTSPLLPTPSGAGRPVPTHHSGEAVGSAWPKDKIEDEVDDGDEWVRTEEELLVDDHGEESSESTRNDRKNDFVVRVSSLRHKGSSRDDKMWRRCDRSSTFKGKDEPWITMAVLLPNDTRYEPCLENVLPAILKAVVDARKRGLLMPYDNETAGNGQVEIVPRDSKCTANYANLGAVEAYANDCANVIFGPSCEFAVASVARFVPFWNIPLLTAGGFTYDFTNPKTDPDSEYYMLTRLGISFRDLAFTIMATTDKFDWSKMLLMYEVDGYSSVSGTQTCKMMMSTMVWFLKNSTKTYSTYDMQKNAKDGLLENLRREVGTTYGGECSSARHLRPFPGTNFFRNNR